MRYPSTVVPRFRERNLGNDFDLGNGLEGNRSLINAGDSLLLLWKIKNDIDLGNDAESIKTVP